ncbi:MAG: hypothetical protein R3190_13940, partial [Thermoanaerobaculia bacterium]|nr:hypothetical protein [Thermoanaerobaculia bacterium]
VPSLLAGRGGRAYAALLIPVSILTLPRMGSLGYPLSWGVAGGSVVVWAATLAVLAAYLGARLAWTGRMVGNVD